MKRTWNGQWANTLKGRRELLVQFTITLQELDDIRERLRFMRALTQKAVVELQKHDTRKRKGDLK
jgi:hypothetical protein